MALERTRIELAISKDVYDAIPLSKKIAFRDMVRWLKARSVNINEGQPNQEITTVAVHHICHHDERFIVPCEPEQEI